MIFRKAMEGGCTYIMQCGPRMGMKCGRLVTYNQRCHLCNSRDQLVDHLKSIGATPQKEHVCRHAGDFSGEGATRPQVYNGYCFLCLAHY